MTRLIASMWVAVLVGCGGGGSSPKTACEDYAEVYCMQVFACLTDAERAVLQLPATEAACVTETQSATGCAAITEDNVCDAGQTYQPDRAADCIDQLGALECSNVRDGLDQATDYPACGEYCVVE